MSAAQGRLGRRLRAGASMLAEYPRRLFSRVSFSAIVVGAQVDRTAALDSKVRFYRSTMGRYSYVARGSFVESTDIGSFCSIGSDCNVGGAGHPLDHVSTSPVFHSGGNILGKVFAPIEFEPFRRTVIENDVWIGQGAKVRAGVHISTGAVVGMGSVLTKDVGPYEIWAGNPARLIRKRFDDETIAGLLASRWWGWDDRTVASHASSFSDPSLLLGELE